MQLNETLRQVGGLSLFHTLDFESFGCLVFGAHMWLTEDRMLL